MRTLFLAPFFEVESYLMNPTLLNEENSRVFGARRELPKPRRVWNLRMGATEREEAERLWEFATQLGGYEPFWFDGNGWGEIKHPQLFGFGDGATKEFMLPWDHCFPSSWILYENGIPKTDWSMTGENGAVFFTAAPATDSELTGAGLRKFKCVFQYNDRVHDEAEFVFELYRQAVIIREVE